MVGDVANDRSLEHEGERENAMGRARQATNDVFDETDGVRGATVGATASSSPYVSGLYRTPDEATRAYSDLTTKHAYGLSDIDVLMTDDTRKRHFGDVARAPSSKAAPKLPKGWAPGV